MRFLPCAFVSMLLLAAAFPVANAGPRAEVRGDRFFVDGKPFFIRAVGYAPWRPGQWPDPPTEQVDPELIDADLRRIKEAGFNTIRTWGSLNKREIALAEKHGLMIIQGVWLNPNIDYGNPTVQEGMLSELRWEVEMARHSPNILMWMPITEPKPSAVLGTGTAKTEAFFRKIHDTIRSLDDRPISLDSWLSVGFMDHSMWDVVTFNTFAFAPESVTHALTFEGYNAWIRDHVARGKPYFVGETGGYSVSPSTFGVKGGGAGGFTEEEQSRLNLACLRDIEKAGAAGWTLVAWNDTWHYPEDPDTQDPNEPWEWDGIIGFDGGKNLVGVPRRIFYDLPAFNAGAPKRLMRIAGRRAKPLPHTIEITTKPDRRLLGQPVALTVRVMRDGRPVAHMPVRIGFFIPEPWQEAKADGVTDRDGTITLTAPLLIHKSDQVLILAAGAYDRKGRPTGRDIRFLTEKELHP